jgi:hypothetical protein
MRVFLHNHPFFNPKVATDAVYDTENSDAANKFGAEVFKRRNPEAL